MTKDSSLTKESPLGWGHLDVPVQELHLRTWRPSNVQTDQVYKHLHGWAGISSSGQNQAFGSLDWRPRLNCLFIHKFLWPPPSGGRQVEEGLQQLHVHQGGLGQVHHQQVQLDLSTWWPSVCHLAPYVSSAIGLPLFEPSLTYSLHSPSTRCESTSTSRSCSCTSPCSTSPRSQCYVSCQANCRDLRRRGGINICFALSNTQWVYIPLFFR